MKYKRCFLDSLKVMTCFIAALSILVVQCTAYGYYIFRRRMPRVRNVIIMISDGCGYNHIDATSYYQYGVKGNQVYEKFPVRVGMSTYQIAQGYETEYAWRYFDYVTKAYTDSAAAATAMSTGIKTYSGAIGMDLDKKPVKHILERAEERGKATGVVTTMPFSHATPAAFVAHVEDRNQYMDIAYQMIYDSAVDVIMGCGHPMYTNDNQPGYPLDIDGDGRGDFYDYRYVGGFTVWNDISDGVVTGADADGDGYADNWTVIHSREEFQSLIDNPHPPKRVLGIPLVNFTLQQARSGDEHAAPYAVSLNAGVPTLAEMTKGALNVLGQDPDGFFLMVEGGAIDKASHGHQSGRMIEEQIDFNHAVEAVVEWVEANSSWSETLLIVTADHECGYLTGPGSGRGATGWAWKEIVNNGAGNMPGMEWHSYGHTNQLVPFYVKGRYCFRFYMWMIYRRNYDIVHRWYIDNTDIARVIFYLLQ